MTIADQITRLNNAKASIKESIINKGIDVPDDALLDSYSGYIDSISGGGVDPYYKNFYNMRTNNGTDMTGLFAYCTAQELDLSNLDTSKVTSMKYMFNNSLASVNIDGWDTKNVIDMSYMFYYFSGSIDISKLDTSSVTNVSYMFAYANTDNIILTGLSFPSATSLSYMFNYAKGTTLDLSSWDISNITSMYYMFNNADYKRIDLTGWKTTNVTNMNSMFYKYSNPLEELIIPDWDMTNVTNNSNFIVPSYMSKLKLIDLSRSNDTTITKIASCLPTRTATTFGEVMVPSNTSQATLDTLIAKYWKPISESMTLVPTSIEIVSELDQLVLGMNNSTRVHLDNWYPWFADPSKVEIVMTSDSSIATIEGDTITSTGVLGDIVLEARVIDTQEVIGTKTIPVTDTETDLYPNVVKFRVIDRASSYDRVITVNHSDKQLSDLTYDSITDIYSYDAGEPITHIQFNEFLGELVKLNTSNITNMDGIFRECYNLTSINTSNWDTSNVINMSNMFISCRSLTSLDLSSFDTSKVNYMDGMFCYCESLTSLDISNFDVSNIHVDFILEGCTGLQTLRLDNCNTDTIDKIIAFNSGIPVNNYGTIYCRESEAAGLTPPGNWVFEYVDAEPEIPDNTIAIYTVNDANETSPNSVGNKAADWEETVIDNEDGTYTVFATGSELPNKLSFSGRTALVSVSYINTSNITDMIAMFTYCSNLTSLDVSKFNTSNVTSMQEMFHHCSSLTSLDLSNFDTSNVTNMSSMFYRCYSLTELDLSNFNTSNVTSMYCMFNSCESLTSLDISNFDTSKVTNIDYMFNNCSKLHTLHLDNCSNDTINKIITSQLFPTEVIEGVTRTIYCKESEAAGLTPPGNWVFSYIEE